MIKVKAVYDFLDSFAPFSTAAEWDNTGLSVGGYDEEVTKILVALDVTKAVIEKAKELGAQLVITHHPLIFNPVKAVEKESILYEAVSSGITFLSSHTCLDKAAGGVNDCLAEKVGITEQSVSEKDEFLRVGTVKNTTATEFAAHLKDCLGGAVRYYDNGKVIKKVAFCSGSGGDFCFLAKEEGANALLTGDASHHDFLAAEECGISLFAAGHFETENPVCEYLEERLQQHFKNEIEVFLYQGESVINTLS